MFTQLISMHNFDLNERPLRSLEIAKIVFKTVSFFLHECTYYNTAVYYTYNGDGNFCS
jgi:hypothetical protein